MRENSGTRLYFAYGSNLDPRQMAARCPDSAVLGSAVLANHRLIFNSKGFATIIAASGSQTWGALWNLKCADECALDDYEGVADGLYRKEFLPVRNLAGNPVNALVYVANDFTPGIPALDYLRGILFGARFHHLPVAYQQVIEAVGNRLPAEFERGWR